MKEEETANSTVLENYPQGEIAVSYTAPFEKFKEWLDLIPVKVDEAKSSEQFGRRSQGSDAITCIR